MGIILGTISADKFSSWSLGGDIGDLINRCFCHDTIEKIMNALETECNSPDAKLANFALKQIQFLKEASPISLKVTLEQLRRGAKLDFASCFRMEYNMVNRFLVTKDFSEGVTAKLIEKRNPKWESMDSATSEEVNKFFIDKKKLNLYNRLSFYDYPHKTLSGLPTDKDIRRIVMGEGSLQANAIPKNRQEVLNWVLEHWGAYSVNSIAEYNIPSRISLDGGSRRGKVGLLEKVQSILERRTEETASGLVWKQ